jgi:hypothetical protein
MLLLLITFLISSIVLQGKNKPVELFVEGLKNENSGYFEEAIINYEIALKEVKNNRFYSDLKNKLVEKLKVLHTIIEYKNNLRFTRLHNQFEEA